MFEKFYVFDLIVMWTDTNQNYSLEIFCFKPNFFSAVL